VAATCARSDDGARFYATASMNEEGGDGDGEGWFAAPFARAAFLPRSAPLVLPGRLVRTESGSPRAKPPADAQSLANPFLWLDFGCCGIGVWMR
jgi:hypothetical protein